MMIRLGRGDRWRAALLLSILYVLTVLSPTLANASGVSRSQHRHEHQMQSHQHDHGSPQTEDHQDHSKQKLPGMVDLQCCGLACISALPAIGAQLLAPAFALGLIQAAEVSEGASRLPPQRYRPPII